MEGADIGYYCVHPFYVNYIQIQIHWDAKSTLSSIAIWIEAKAGIVQTKNNCKEVAQVNCSAIQAELNLYLLLLSWTVDIVWRAELKYISSHCGGRSQQMRIF